jgi:DnaJ-class molecular chaperone
MSTVHLTIDSYAVLGVSQIADIKEINAVYKRLALKSHPDKAGGTEAAIERFREVC